MEPQYLTLKTIFDAIKRFNEDTNEVLRGTRAWLAQGKSIEKQNFRQIVSQNSKAASSFLAQYTGKNFEELESKQIEQVIAEIEEFYSNITKEIESCNVLINALDTLSPTDAQRDIEVLNRFLDGVATAEETIANYLPEMRKWNIVDLFSKTESNININNGPDNTNTSVNTSNLKPESTEDIAYQDQVNNVIDKAKEFINLIDKFTAENAEWFYNTADHNNTALKNMIVKAVSDARTIVDNNNNLLTHGSTAN